MDVEKALDGRAGGGQLTEGELRTLAALEEGFLAAQARDPAPVVVPAAPGLPPAGGNGGGPSAGVRAACDRVRERLERERRQKYGQATPAGPADPVPPGGFANYCAPCADPLPPDADDHTQVPAPDDRPFLRRTVQSPGPRAPSG